MEEAAQSPYVGWICGVLFHIYKLAPILKTTQDIDNDRIFRDSSEKQKLQ